MLAFSGGKDSLVILHTLHKIGAAIHCVSIRTAELDYPTHLNYLATFDNCEIVSTWHTIEWLSQHTEFLFPESSAVRNKWFRMIQRGGCQKYSRRYGADLLIWGRRDQENTCNGDSYDLHGIIQAHPIRDWRTEEVWLYLRHYQVRVSPLYDLPLAHIRGVHRWNTRRRSDGELNPFTVIAKYAPAICEKAALYFPEARKALGK